MLPKKELITWEGLGRALSLGFRIHGLYRVWDLGCRA